MSAEVCKCCGQPLPNNYAKIADRAGLSRRERLLFLSIAAGHGDAVASAKVIDDIWGDDPAGGPLEPRNTIFVMIRRSNAKLDRLHYAIKTVRGFGYRIELPEAA